MFRISCTALFAVFGALIAVTVPPSASAAAQGPAWWERSRCHGVEGVAWIECQKAIRQAKRDRKEGRDPSQRPGWEEKSRCLGLEGLSWAECQKANSNRKRDIAAGRDPNARPEWWQKSKCLGLTGVSWIECQKALKRLKRAKDADR